MNRIWRNVINMIIVRILVLAKFNVHIYYVIGFRFRVKSRSKCGLRKVKIEA